MLIDKIQADVISAMKARNEFRVGVLRFLISGIKRFEIDNYLPGSTQKLTDDDVIKIIKKQIKERNESIIAFTKGNRINLAEKEKQELKILEEYAPKNTIKDAEIRKIVKEIISSGTTDFGKIMGQVMGRLKGQAEGAQVSKIVREEIK